MSVERPWARQKNPQPILRSKEPAKWAGLDDELFLRVIRDNLFPRDETGGRDRWKAMWGLLAARDELADRAYDALERLMDATEADLDSGGLTEVEAKRARRYLDDLNKSWERLGSRRWRPGLGQGWPPRARQIVAALVTAIDTHRAAVGEDAGGEDDIALWSVLEAYRLDPHAWRPEQHR